MRALAGGGHRAAALTAYAHCCQLLRNDLGIEPDSETRALADELHASAGPLVSVPPPAIPAPPVPASPPLPSRVPLHLPSHNLPAPIASFVGRDAVLARLTDLLGGDARLMTLLGAGGVGKTRLALAAAWALRARFTDGVWWVPLVGVQPGDASSLPHTAVATAIATALGITLGGRRDALHELTVALRDCTALLVLDNCEHLPEVATVAGALLRAAPALRLLATSREPLDLNGETLVRLDGLSVPSAGSHATAGYPSVRLFRERATRYAPGWERGGRAEVEGVARLCRLLDGLPLGIELAARWVGHYTPDEIATAIESDPDFLAVHTRDVLDRHHSMRAMFDYAWRLLNADERQALARLTVFRGVFDRAAAQTVAAVRAPTLAALVDKSLLRQAGVGRYSLHELLRQFAAEQLATSGEATALGDHHAAYYLAFAEAAAPALVGPEQAAWTARLDREGDNLRAALAWMHAHGQMETEMRLAGALTRFWFIRGYSTEGRGWLEGALAHVDAATPPAIRARVLHGAGLMAACQGDAAQAAAWLEEGIALYQAAGDPISAVRALNNLGGVAYDAGDLRAAIARCEESVAQARAAHAPDEAAPALGNVGETLYHLGELTRAAAYLEEALALNRQAGHADGEAVILGNLGNVALRQGDLPRAQALHRQALTRKRDLGAQRLIASALEDIASLVAAEGQAAHAARLIGAAYTLRAAIGNPQPAPERIAMEQAVAAARATLGEAAWAAAFTTGQSLTLDEAITDALG